LAVRFIAKQVMPQLVRLFETTDQIIGYLRTQGLSYRRQNMLDDIRVLRGREDRSESWETFEPWRDLTEGKLIDMHLKDRPEYRVIGTAYWTDLETGETSTNVVSYYTDALTNMTELEAEISWRYGQEERYAGRIFAGFEIIDIWHNLTPREWLGVGLREL